MRHIVLLRGINLGARRIAMPRLRDVLAAAGFTGVATYVQSGNVVLDSPDAAGLVREHVETVIEEAFGFHADAVLRTRDELAGVVDRRPFGTAVTDPRRLQVTFCAAEPDAAHLEDLAAPGERVAVAGREVFTWHPDGMGRSRLAKATTAKRMGVATARNFATVTALLALADGVRGPAG